MKLLTALFYLILSVFSVCYADESIPSGILPGSSSAQVFLSEKRSPDLNEERLLVYNTSDVFPVPASAIYAFDSSSTLCSSIYHFRRHYSNDRNYIQDYQDVDQILTSAYGKPTSSSSSWSENSLINPKTKKPEEIAKAVAWGYATFTSVWNMDDYCVMHKLASSDMQIQHWISYSPVVSRASRKEATEIQPSIYPDSHVADILSSELEFPSSYTDSSLYFSGNDIFGLKSDILYNLKADHTLDSCTIIFPSYCTVDDYNGIQSALISQYGEPSNDLQYWKDSFLSPEEASDPEVLALAYKSNLVSFSSEWILPDCKITHTMNNDTFRPHTITYSAKHPAVDYSDIHYALEIAGGKHGPASQYDYRFRTFVSNHSSTQTITAFSVLVEAYNAYGEALRWYGVGENSHTFTFDSKNIDPGDTYAMPNKYWEFNGFNNASSVKACISRYHTSDGITIEIPVDKRIWVEIPYVSEFQY